MTSYKVGKNEYFKDGFGIQPNFWRGPNDYYYGNGAPQRLQVWKQSSKNFNVIETKVSPEGDNFIVDVTYLLAAGNLYNVKYKILPSGILNVNVLFHSTDFD